MVKQLNVGYDAISVMECKLEIHCYSSKRILECQ